MSRLQLIVLGGLGRMGRAILEAKASEPDIDLKGVVVKEGSLQGESLQSVSVVSHLSKIGKRGDVVIDVTRAESVLQNVKAAHKLLTPYVLAVTGYGKEVEKACELASKEIPIVVASNLSIGVAVLSEVISKAAEFLPETDVEIIETHHRNKKDAPSGTALSLAEAVMLGASKEREILLGRPSVGARDSETIAIHAVRGGDVVGEHRVRFLLDGEQLEFSHMATNRIIFAKGALRAARFVAKSKPGLYTMKDVLGFTS